MLLRRKIKAWRAGKALLQKKMAYTGTKKIQIWNASQSRINRKRTKSHKEKEKRSCTERERSILLGLRKKSTKVSIKNKNKIPTYYYRVFSCPYESFCFIKASALIKHGKGKRLFWVVFCHPTSVWKRASIPSPWEMRLITYAQGNTMQRKSKYDLLYPAKVKSPRNIMWNKIMKLKKA